MEPRGRDGAARCLDDPPNAKPLGGVSVAGTLDATDSIVALNGATIQLGDTRATGAISARLTGARPLVKANLKLAELDIDRLTAYFDGSKPIGRTKPKALAAGPQAPAAAQPRSIEDLLRGTATEGGGAGRFSPQVRGYTKSRGWDQTPIETSALKAIDADARLLVAGLRVAGLAIGQTSMRATLNGGSARADIDDIVLYGGRGRGVITARPSGNGLKVGLNISVSDVSAEPLLKDAAEIDLIAGRGRLTAALGSTGGSQQNLMSNLAGKASFTFTDGAIIGWNIPQMLRGLQRGQVSDLAQVSTEKTDFSELSANFTVSRGVANTQDLRMTSPLLRLTGSGNTDIGQRGLDIILRPKLVASLSGQGGDSNISGVEIPVRVTGSWDDPKATPDLGGVLQNPNNVVDTVKAIGKQFKGKSANEIVEGLFGGGGNEGSGGQGNAAGNLLKQLFKN